METISPSALISVIEAQQYFGNSPEAERGREEHKRIVEEMCAGRLPPLLARAGVDEITKGKKLQVLISGILVLSSIPDAQSKPGPIELKSGSKLQGKHLLQSAIECWVSGGQSRKNINGYVYLFDGEKLAILEGGGCQHYQEIGQLAIVAKDLIKYQEEIGTLNRRKGCDAIKIKMLADKAIVFRRENQFDGRVITLINQLDRETQK